MGSAGIVVLDDRCCMVQLGIRFSEFYEHESCGKCTPCREGTRWLTRSCASSRTGGRRRATSTCCSDVCDRILGKCLCPLGDFARSSSRATSRSSATSSRRTSTDGGCPFDGDSSLDHVLAPIQMHAHSPAQWARGVGSWLSSSRSRSTSGPCRCRRAPGWSRRRPRAGIEIPVFCYEPRLGPPVGACRMCLVRGRRGCRSSQAGCTLTGADGMVVKTARTSEKAAEGAERDARVHPRQPPARLPGLRQGRRVPAAGPDVPLRARATRG